MFDFHGKGADFKRDLMGDVQNMVGRMLSNINATFAAQKDGTVVSDAHRVLNFQGPGVVIADDPTQRRTNVYIGGAGLISTPTQLVLSATTSKAFSLWNGTSNNTPPAYWQTLAFNDSGWAAAVAPSAGAATTIPGATRLWSSLTPAGLTEQTLFRHTFTAPAGTYQAVTLTVEADNYIDAAYVNGTLVGSATNGVPGSSPSKATLSVTPGLIVAGGTNVLAVLARNADPPSGGSAWMAYVINSTLVTTATSNTVSAFLAANVTMTTANTYYDGPSISLTAGTWLVMAGVDCGNESTGAGQVAAKLWDGTTVYGTAEQNAPSAGVYATPFTSAVVALSGTTTLKISAATQQNGSIMRAALRVNSAGNNATHIMAFQIG